MIEAALVAADEADLAQVLEAASGSSRWASRALLSLRALGPAEAGLYWICLAAVKIATGSLSDPMDLAVLRYAPPLFDSDPGAAYRSIRAAFWWRVGVSAAILAVAWIAAQPIASLMLHSGAHRLLVILTGVAVLGEVAARGAVGYFQARERFGWMVATDAILQVSRVGFVLILLAAGRLDRVSALLAYAVAPFAAFAIARWAVPRELRQPRVEARFAEVFDFGKWLFVAMVLAALFERLDVMLLGALRGPGEVGRYAPAAMLALLPELVVGVELTVLSPRVSAHYAQGSSGHFLTGYTRYAIPIALAGIAAAFLLAGPVITLLFGAPYADSAPLLRILAVGTLGSAAVAPLCTVLLSMIAPRQVLLIALAALVAVALGGFAAIPAHGAAGAAWVITTVRLAIAALVVWRTLWLTRRRPAPLPAVPVQAAQAAVVTPPASHPLPERVS